MRQLLGPKGIVRPDGSPSRREPTVALGYCFGTLHAEFVHSLHALRERDVMRMATGEHVYVRYRIPEGGLYIDHNRNRVVQQFMKCDAEWLLQIDTDIEFPPDLPEKLIELCGTERKVLAASVPLDGFPSCGWMMTESPGVWAGLPSEQVTAEGVQVDGIATACCLIHRSVLEAIADQVGQMWFFKTLQPRLIDESSRAAWEGRGPLRDRQYVNVGEDLAFSMRAADAGFKCYVAKVKGLRHWKRGPLSHDFEELDRPSLSGRASAGAVSTAEPAGVPMEARG